MNHRVRNIIISACVVVGLAGGVFFINRIPEKSTTSSSSSSSSIALLSYDSSKFKSMKVTSANSNYTVSYTDGTYHIDTLQNAPTNQDAVKAKVADAVSAKATKLIAKNASDLAQYGLSPASLTISIATNDGKTTELKIGNKSASSSGVYVQKPGTNDVYLSSALMNDDFSQSPLVYASVTVSQLSTSAQLTNYQFGGASRTTPISVKVTPKTSSGSTTYTYNVTSPINYEANTTNLDAITTALQSLSATSVASVDMSSSSLSNYGLLNPAYTLTYTADGKDTTLSFGNADANSHTVYMTVTGKSAIYQVDTSSAATFYNYDANSILSNAVLSDSLDTLKTLTVQTGSTSHTFSFSGSSNSLKVQTDGKTLNTDNFQNYYQSLLSLSTRGTASKPSNPSTAMTLTLTFRDSKTPQKTIIFYPYDNDKDYVEINGVGALYVYNSDLSPLITETDQVAADKKIS